MALNILSIPSMSAESERVFSGTRRQITFDRLRLNGSSIEKSECLKSWIKNDIEPIMEGSRAGTPANDEESEDVNAGGSGRGTDGGAERDFQVSITNNSFSQRPQLQTT
jgi:hypothetical protein